MRHLRLFSLYLALVLLATACQQKPSYTTAIIETEFGNIKVALYNETPLHRDNFIKLANQGYYDGTLFHRVITNFMIQGGDPDSKGAAPDAMLGNGGPGYTVPAEILPQFTHVRGALCAARMPDQMNPTKASSGSQFYIVQGAKVDASMLQMVEQQKGFRYTDEQKQDYLAMGGYPGIDGDYTVFGQVLEGYEVIDKIGTTFIGKFDRPQKDIAMKVRIGKK